jgi:ATP/maltotriose-dependent transcriptional regulator MalT
MEARASDVFVGRAGELGELERALDATRAGTGAAVLVAGQAGIGKTRLASELARRARAAGFEVLFGRSIDLVGTELPYQPFAEALRPLGEPWQADRQAAGSQLRVFEETLALLTGCAAAAPVLLVLEDLHWADTSTLDLVVFLAHNLSDRPVLLLVTCRADEPSSAGRIRRLAEGVRRSGSALVLELGPLGRDELTALLMAHAGAALPAAITDAIAARSEGNPFFAEELLAASSGQGVELPKALRDLLLQRVARLDHPTQGVLRLAAAAGREVGYPLLRATVELPDGALRDSLRAAVEGGVLVTEPETGSFRFRHALLAEAIYTTILPGEREDLHARLAGELARSGVVGAAELAPHWAAAGRTAEALAASVEAARRPRRSSASRRLTRNLSGRSRSGPRCWTRPGSPGSTSLDSAPGPPGLPATSVLRHTRSSWHGGRSGSPARKTHTVRRSFTCISVSTSTRPEMTALRSLRSSARSSSSRRSWRRRSARSRWGHLRGD